MDRREAEIELIRVEMKRLAARLWELDAETRRLRDEADEAAKWRSETDYRLGLFAARIDAISDEMGKGTE